MSEEVNSETISGLTSLGFSSVLGERLLEKHPSYRLGFMKSVDVEALFNDLVPKVAETMGLESAEWEVYDHALHWMVRIALTTKDGKKGSLDFEWCMVDPDETSIEATRAFLHDLVIECVQESGMKTGTSVVNARDAAKIGTFLEDKICGGLMCRACEALHIPTGFTSNPKSDLMFEIESWIPYPGPEDCYETFGVRFNIPWHLGS